MQPGLAWQTSLSDPTKPSSTYPISLGPFFLKVLQGKPSTPCKGFKWLVLIVTTSRLVEINLGVMCYSMPVVCGYFVGRLSSLGKSLSSWVHERRARRYGSSDGSASHAPDKDALVPPSLPQPTPTATLTGVRKFINNLYRSGARTYGRDTTALSTFNETSTPVMDYHEHLRAQKSQPTFSRGHEQV